MKYEGEPFQYSRWWKERCLYALLALLGKPGSYLDVGCGDAYFLEIMGTLIGEEVLGVDITGDSQLVRAHDLRQPLDLGNKFEMVVSLEVGEHLPPQSADTYCDTLVRHTGKWLVFSAAQIGQGGNMHINEQYLTYWLEKFLARGLSIAYPQLPQVVSVWGSIVPKEYSWAYNNLMIFRVCK